VKVRAQLYDRSDATVAFLTAVISRLRAARLCIALGSCAMLVSVKAALSLQDDFAELADNECRVLSMLTGYVPPQCVKGQCITPDGSTSTGSSSPEPSSNTGQSSSSITNSTAAASPDVPTESPDTVQLANRCDVSCL
jgi:hypothetical protein